MQYLKNLFIRLVLCFAPLSWFSFFLFPLTIYGTYLLLFYYSPVVSGNLLIVNGFPFEFIEACVATVAYYFLWLLCLLTKDIKLKTRFKIIVYGFLMIYVLNIIRIVILIILATEFGFQWFNAVHMLFWKFLSGLYIAFVWIFLVTKYKVKSIPLYDDLKTLYGIIFKKNR